MRGKIAKVMLDVIAEELELEPEPKRSELRGEILSDVEAWVAKQHKLELARDQDVQRPRCGECDGTGVRILERVLGQVRAQCAKCDGTGRSK